MAAAVDSTSIAGHAPICASGLINRGAGAVTAAKTQTLLHHEDGFEGFGSWRQGYRLPSSATNAACTKKKVQTCATGIKLALPNTVSNGYACSRPEAAKAQALAVSAETRGAASPQRALSGL